MTHNIYKYNISIHEKKNPSIDSNFRVHEKGNNAALKQPSFTVQITKMCIR